MRRPKFEKLVMTEDLKGMKRKREVRRRTNNLSRLTKWHGKDHSGWSGTLRMAQDRGAWSLALSSGTRHEMNLTNVLEYISQRSFLMFLPSRCFCVPAFSNVSSLTSGCQEGRHKARLSRNTAMKIILHTSFSVSLWYGTKRGKISMKCVIILLLEKSFCTQRFWKVLSSQNK